MTEMEMLEAIRSDLTGLGICLCIVGGMVFYIWLRTMGIIEAPPAYRKKNGPGGCPCDCDDHVRCAK